VKTAIFCLLRKCSTSHWSSPEEASADGFALDLRGTQPILAWTSSSNGEALHSIAEDYPSRFLELQNELQKALDRSAKSSPLKPKLRKADLGTVEAALPSLVPPWNRRGPVASPVARLFYSTSGGANFCDLSHLGVMGTRASHGYYLSSASSHAAMTVWCRLWVSSRHHNGDALRPLSA
jgi:hypothetical protein